MKSLLGYSIFLFFFTAPSVFVGFKNVSALENKNSSKACVKGGLPSMVNLLCNHDHTMTAMNLKLKFKLKPLKKKLHFSSILIAFTSGFEKDSLKSGAQTLLNPWSSADHAVTSVPDSRCPVPTSLFPVLHSPFFVLLFHSPFIVPRSK